MNYALDKQRRRQGTNLKFAFNNTSMYNGKNCRNYASIHSAVHRK